MWSKPVPLSKVGFEDLDVATICMLWPGFEDLEVATICTCPPGLEALDVATICMLEPPCVMYNNSNKTARDKRTAEGSKG